MNIDDLAHLGANALNPLKGTYRGHPYNLTIGRAYSRGGR